MRLCGKCRKPVRTDDPLTVVQVTTDNASTLTVEACSSCGAELLGLPVPDEPVYPAGRDYPFAVCGVCRRAMREGDDGTPLRLTAREADGLSVRPALYDACADCVAFFRPAIYARLDADGLTLPPYESFGGHWLV